eukprot:SAG31_NODE_3938_length_3735_cov_3.200220_5_plen_74_part_00
MPNSLVLCSGWIFAPYNGFVPELKHLCLQLNPQTQPTCGQIGIWENNSHVELLWMNLAGGSAMACSSLFDPKS